MHDAYRQRHHRIVFTRTNAVRDTAAGSLLMVFSRWCVDFKIRKIESSILRCYLDAVFVPCLEVTRGAMILLCWEHSNRPTQSLELYSSCKLILPPSLHPLLRTRSEWRPFPNPKLATLPPRLTGARASRQLKINTWFDQPCLYKIEIFGCPCSLRHVFVWLKLPANAAAAMANLNATCKTPSDQESGHSDQLVILNTSQA